MGTLSCQVIHVGRDKWNTRHEKVKLYSRPHVLVLHFAPSGYGLHTWGSVLGGAVIILFTSSEAHPASYPMGTVGGQSVRLTAHFHLVPKL